jgi:hypothetical protein
MTTKMFDVLITLTKYWQLVEIIQYFIIIHEFCPMSFNVKKNLTLYIRTNI